MSEQQTAETQQPSTSTTATSPVETGNQPASGNQSQEPSQSASNEDEGSLFGDLVSKGIQERSRDPKAPDDIEVPEKFRNKETGDIDGKQVLKSYLELEKKLKTRAPEVPDSYEFTETFKEAGLVARDPEEAKEQYESFTAQLKEQGFNQNQLKWMTKFGAEWLQEQLRANGPKIDVEAQRTALAKEWGEAAGEEASRIGQWATANLPADVIKYPLHQTAAGLKFLKQIMEGNATANPITTTGRTPARSADEIVVEMNKLLQSKDYYEGTPQVKNALHAQMDKLSGELAKVRKR